MQRHHALAATKVLSVTALSKHYGDTLAGWDFIRAGDAMKSSDCWARTEPGKTTTINMILGVLAPTSGSIRIQDLDLATHRSQALDRTNFAAVYAPLPGNLTVYQNLRVFGLLYKVGHLA